MHELSIAHNIVEIAQQHLPPRPDIRVKSVRVRVGELTGIVKESLEFSFTAITHGTRLEGAILEVDKVLISLQCRRCGEVAPSDLQTFLCPSCGTGDVTMVHGKELLVTELELYDEQDAP